MGITEKADIFTIAQYGDIKSFKEKFKIDDLNKKKNTGSSLLHLSIVGSNFDIAMYLIENGIDVQMTNSDGQTALHYICDFPNIEVAEAILEKSTDIHIRDKWGNNALWTAAFNCKGRYYDMVRLLMKYNPDIYNINNVGKSPLDIANITKDNLLTEILTKGVVT